MSHLLRVFSDWHKPSHRDKDNYTMPITMSTVTGKWNASPERTVAYTIQGKEATSYEYNFGLALEYYKIEYLFQVWYWGGRTTLGGMVLDFLVFTNPLPTPVFINGEYAHSGKRQMIDFLQESMLNTGRAGEFNPVKVYWADDVVPYEAAQNTVRRDLL
jgi:hypothetical protein